MSLASLLKPRSIAVIGASDNPKRIGGVPVELLIRAGYDKLFPVNPKGATVQGLTAYPDIESVPEPIDLALVAIGADDVLAMLERCHAVGVNAAMVFAAGYAETNEAEGQAKQAALAAFATRTGMRIAGPNCMGNANFGDRVFTTFGSQFQPEHAAGSTALLTQSGNMCATVYRTARRAGVAFSHVINTGNEADVDFADYLDFLADDDATQTALCYIEELRDGASFLRAAAKFRAAGKLLTVFKVGASAKGAEAARSHTAALAGDNAAYDAAFSTAGVARVGELSGLADLAYLHGFAERIGGNACAILSVSGAAGAILSDALALAGGVVPTLPDTVQAGLRAQIPAYGMVSNPVDLTGNLVNANDFLLEAIRLALSPDSIDVLLLYLPGNFLIQAMDQVERATAATGKLIIAIDTFAMGDRETLAAKRIAYFEDFDRAARAIAAYGAWKAQPATVAKNGKAKASWPVLPDRPALSETESKEALARFGVPVVHDAVVHGRAEAREAAQKLGYPLVAKLVSPDVAHKTEHGLIRLGLHDADAVVDAFDAMMAKARSMPGVRIDGVTLEPMLAGGVEILAGVTRDPVFGWMLTVGLGGVWTELMKDVQHRLLPVDAAGAETMLRGLKGFALLDGYRGAPKGDVAAAARAIAALGDAVLAGGERLREVEVNPLLVMPEGRGAVAVDALVLLNCHDTFEEAA